MKNLPKIALGAWREQSAAIKFLDTISAKKI